MYDVWIIASIVHTNIPIKIFMNFASLAHISVCIALSLQLSILCAGRSSFNWIQNWIYTNFPSWWFSSIISHGRNYEINSRSFLFQFPQLNTILIVFPSIRCRIQCFIRRCIAMNAWKNQLLISLANNFIKLFENRYIFPILLVVMRTILDKATAIVWI